MFYFRAVRIDFIDLMTICCHFTIINSHIGTCLHLSFRSCSSILHITDIRRVVHCSSATCDIGDLFTACINTTVLSDARTICNG